MERNRWGSSWSCFPGILRGNEKNGGSQGQRPVGSGMADGEDGFGKIGKKNAAERSVNAHAAFLVRRKSLLFPIKQPYPVKHPGSLDIPGDPVFPLYKWDVVDFLKAFPA